MPQNREKVKTRGRPTISESEKLKPRFTLALSEIEYENFLAARKILGIKKGELARSMIEHTSNEIISGNSKLIKKAI